MSESFQQKFQKIERISQSRLFSFFSKEEGNGNKERAHQFFPLISTGFDPYSASPSSLFYGGSIRSALRRILPNDLLFNEIKNEQMRIECLTQLHQMLPIVKWFEWGSSPVNVSIFLFCRSKINAGKFFYEMISRWLIPGKRLNIGLFFSSEFKMLDLDPTQLYTICEAAITLDDPQELEMIHRNLPVLQAEICLGVVSVYHASRILEIKGLTADEKTALIQEKMVSLVQRRPKDFDYDIFGQMQHFLVMCKEEFKAIREYRCMSRIIYIFYLFRKNLRFQVENFPNKRHLSLKLIKTRIHYPFGVKLVLGLFVGVNFLKENEIFEERHLIKAIQNYLTDVRAVEDSFFVTESRDDKIHTMYLEIERIDGGDFSLSDIQLLREKLREDLKERIEHLMPPIFMPRNEEEVMRNIVTLSGQLRYVRDIPQMIISFDEQTDIGISFTVILLRILHKNSSSIQELFQLSKTDLKYIPDRIKQVGSLRKKHLKEATVFRVRVSQVPFLRSDHSLDLYKARQAVVKELERIIGEIRDFNGGMISKQIEAFLDLKKSLGEIAKQNEFLMENFFHSIFPVESRSTLNPFLMGKLFLMLLDLLNKSRKKKKRVDYTFQEESGMVFISIAFQDFSLRQKLFEVIDFLRLSSSKLVYAHFQAFDIVYLGYIFLCDDQAKRDTFIESIKTVCDVEFFSKEAD